VLFPDTEEKAGLNAIEELLVNGTFDFDCGYHMSTGTVIFVCQLSAIALL